MNDQAANGENWKFNLRSPAELAELACRLGLDVPAQDDLSILAWPVSFAGLTSPNSLAIHPMEGCDGDADGCPGPLTIRRYERFASGGAGLLWIEAVAVVPEGRANPRQLWLNEQSLPPIRAMLERTRAFAANAFGLAHRPVLVAQLTHSGRYSRPIDKRSPLICAHDPYRDPPAGVSADLEVLSDEYFDRLQDAYVTAARLAFEAGFDAVDVKSCHGYLINELLGAHTRPGRYGGSFANRTRFLLEVFERIRDAVGPGRPVVTRLGVYDAVPYPFGWGVDQDDYTRPDLAEPLKLIELLRERGLAMLNVSAANPYYNPHVNRPFDEPVVGGYRTPEHPLIGVARLIDLAGKVQQAFPDLPVVGSGYSWLRTLFANVAAGAKEQGLTTFVGAGRMAFAYPDFAADIINNGRLDERKVCVACSACTQVMRDGGMTGCVVRDSKVYGPIFREGQRNRHK